MIDHLMGVFSQTVTVNDRCISFDAYYLALTLTGGYPGTLLLSDA
mgnify:CR=1 FL=1